MWTSTLVKDETVLAILGWLQPQPHNTPTCLVPKPSPLLTTTLLQSPLLFLSFWILPSQPLPFLSCCYHCCETSSSRRSLIETCGGERGEECLAAAIKWGRSSYFPPFPPFFSFLSHSLSFPLCIYLYCFFFFVALLLIFISFFCVCFYCCHVVQPPPWQNSMVWTTKFHNKTCNTHMWVTKMHYLFGLILQYLYLFPFVHLNGIYWI